MIGGVVNARCEAVVTLRLRGRGGAELAVAAVVDSGFTSAVALPVAAGLALGLVRQSSGGAVLADGSVRQFEIYAADVEWDGAWRSVLVSAVGDEALVGMRLPFGMDPAIGHHAGKVLPQSKYLSRASRKRFRCCSNGLSAAFRLTGNGYSGVVVAASESSCARWIFGGMAPMSNGVEKRLLAAEPPKA